jgi:phosphoenolpyruvate---glycerone phosphotransferase subunit DhaL
MDVVAELDRGPASVARVATPSYTRPMAVQPRPPLADAPVAIDAADLRAALSRARRTIDRHASTLTRLDAVLGDGDHGDNLAIGFRAVEDVLSGLPAETLPGDLLRAVGHCLVSAVGGASGPLYGTAFIEAGFRAGGAAVIDGALAAAMLEAGADGLARRGRCAVGDKTILDTLRPAATALGAAVAAGLDAASAASATVDAARSGMRSTAPLIARRGIALRLGERSIGHLDPGAVSCFLILRALAG